MKRRASFILIEALVAFTMFGLFAFGIGKICHMSRKLHNAAIMHLKALDYARQCASLFEEKGGISFAEDTQFTNYFSTQFHVETILLPSFKSSMHTQTVAALIIRVQWNDTHGMKHSVDLIASNLGLNHAVQ